MIDPAEKVFAITPNDSTALEHDTRAISLAGIGNLAVITVGGDNITILGLAAGIMHPIRLRKVLSTGTTASGIFGYY